MSTLLSSTYQSTEIKEKGVVEICHKYGETDRGRRENNVEEHQRGAKSCEFYVMA